MFYRFGADLVLLVHLLFIGFAIVGGIAVLRWHWLALVHLPAALWATVVELMGWVCPLTPLENELRRAAGTSGYSGGFVVHYVLPVLCPANLDRPTHLLFGFALLTFNVVVYVMLLRRWRSLRSEDV